MIRAIRAHGGPWPGAAWDERVLDVLARVPRHAYVPELTIELAYEDSPQAIGHGQTISQPTIVAMMAQALELGPDSRVLEIGTGSGYHAAVIAELAAEVFTIERHAPLAASARDKLAGQGVGNVHVRAGDGYQGWPEHAPFDRILLTAAPPELPPALVNQLAPGGILVAPIGPDGAVQRLTRYRKQEGELVGEDLGAVRFVPMVPGEAR